MEILPNRRTAKNFMIPLSEDSLTLGLVCSDWWWSMDKPTFLYPEKAILSVLLEFFQIRKPWALVVLRLSWIPKNRHEKKSSRNWDFCFKNLLKFVSESKCPTRNITKRRMCKLSKFLYFTYFLERKKNYFCNVIPK